MFVGWARNAGAAIFLVLLGVAGAMVADNPKLFWTWAAVLGALGVVVFLLALLSERRYRNVRDGLGRLLRTADELVHTPVRDAAGFEKWQADLNEWFQQTQRFLSAELSPTHTALFKDISRGGSYSVRGSFSPEHANFMNALWKYIENLKTITDRYLSNRS